MYYQSIILSIQCTIRAFKVIYYLYSVLSEHYTIYTVYYQSIILSIQCTIRAFKVIYYLYSVLSEHYTIYTVYYQSIILSIQCTIRAFKVIYYLYSVHKLCLVCIVGILECKQTAVDQTTLLNYGKIVCNSKVFSIQNIWPYTK